MLHIKAMLSVIYYFRSKLTLSTNLQDEPLTVSVSMSNILKNTGNRTFTTSTCNGNNLNILTTIDVLFKIYLVPIRKTMKRQFVTRSC